MSTYELWSTDSNNLVDWWHSWAEAKEALRQIEDLRGLRIAHRDQRGKTRWLPALDGAALVESQSPQ